MKCTWLLIFAVFTATVVPSCGTPPAKQIHPPHTARTTCDHLSPLPSPITDPGYRWVPEYEAALAATLFDRLQSGHHTHELLLVMLKDSAPMPQQAVYLLIDSAHSSRSKQYRLVHARAQSRVAPGGPVVEAELTETFLDYEVVRKLERVWTAMTGSARWRTRDEVLGAESNTAVSNGLREFVFDYWGNHVFSQGMAFSPAPETCAAALVSIGEFLMRLADERDPQNHAALRSRILGDLEHLSQRLGISVESLCASSACRVQ